MNEGSGLKFLLIAGAAYLAYNYFYPQSVVPQGTLPATGSTPVPPASTPPPAGTVTGSQKVPIPSASQLESAAAASGYQAPYSFNTYQWNYFYVKAMGGSTPWGPTELYPNDPARETSTHTSADYVTALSSYLHSAGLAGVSRSVASGTALRRRVSVYGWE